MMIQTKEGEPDIFDIPSMKCWFELQGFDYVDRGRLYRFMSEEFAYSDFDPNIAEYSWLSSKCDELEARMVSLHSEKEKLELMIEELRSERIRLNDERDSTE